MTFQITVTPRSALLIAIGFIAVALILNPLSLLRAQSPDGGTRALFGDAFSYQGFLEDASGPANGLHDFQFRLHDSEIGTGTVGPLLVASLMVNDGRFSVPLDFGLGAFDGNARWLQVSVRPAGVGDFEPMAQRLPLTPAPHALYAHEARHAENATSAGSANSAVFAISAGSATTANSAATADFATSAGSAATADFATTAGYANTIPLDGDGTSPSAAHSDHTHPIDPELQNLVDAFGSHVPVEHGRGSCNFESDYLGDLKLVAANRLGYGALPADGRQLSIIQNTALFSLFEFTYGGNGVTHFALPDSGMPPQTTSPTSSASSGCSPHPRESELHGKRGVLP